MALLIQEDPGLARKRKLAEAMMQRGQRTGPVSHWTEGLSRIIDQGAGAYFANKAASQEEARKKASMESLAQAMAGNGMAADGMGPPQPFMSRLENVEGINPEMIASLKLQQAMTPTPRDPVADAIAIERGKAEVGQQFPKPESDIAKLTAALTQQNMQAKTDKLNADAEAKRQDIARKTKEEETAARENKTGAEAYYSSIDNSYNVLDRITKNPELPDVVGSFEGREYYPTSVMASLGNPIDTVTGLATGKPTPADIRADLLQDIGQLKGQEFINNLLDVKSQGATFGSLTEREGAKLETYRQDMTTARSLPAFLEAANNLKGLLEKARARKAEASGIPETAMDLPSTIRTDERGIPTPESVKNINQLYEDRVRRMSQ